MEEKAVMKRRKMMTVLCLIFLTFTLILAGCGTNAEKKEIQTAKGHISVTF